MNAVSIIGVVTAFLFIFLSLLALCAEKGVHPFRRVRGGLQHVRAWEKTFFSLFVSSWIAFAGIKNGEGTNGISQVEGGTNTVTQVEGGTNVLRGVVQGRARIPAAPQRVANGESNAQALRRSRSLRPTMLSPITDGDIAQLWRIGATIDGNAFAAPTANAVTNAAWCDYGGLSDSLRIRPVGWCFPYGAKTATGLTVFESGEFRPNVKTHFFPPPFDAKLSLLPRMNWGVLPDGGESVFWHEQTPSNSLVLTWHNVLYNRDENSHTNFQAELFADGRFDYRYPGRTVQYAPVFPFDWDDDGLENSIDPEPLVAGPDAHGTNTEWYNRVCGNVFTAMEGIELAPYASTVNTNAYYFVDVIAESLAPIYFVADGDSCLGNPIVVARAGETNHVPLLIGATYAISSPVSLQIFAPAEALLEPSWINGGLGYTVHWPVGLGYERAGDLYMPTADEAARVCGTFSWSGGCCMVFNGTTMSFGCHACGCCGCSAYLNYAYEGYLCTVLGPVCGCSSQGGTGSGLPFVPTDSGASLAVGFSKDYVVISSENELEAEEADSTETVLAVTVQGGTHGGTLRFETENWERLSAVGGVMPTWEDLVVAPGETRRIEVVCWGESVSAFKGDVCLSATFTENETGVRVCRNARLTVCSFRIGGIKFNHDPSAYAVDAINIRPSGNLDVPVPPVEWTEGGWTNFPVCYARNVSPTLKVNIRLAPTDFSAQADISAVSITGGLGNTVTQTVTVVSGESGWVEMPLVDAVPNQVDRFDQRWRWRVSNVNGTDSPMFGMAKTGPHRIYVTMAHPVHPWSRSVLSRMAAWTNTLEFCCGVAKGQASTSDVLTVLTQYLFDDMGYVYANDGSTQYGGELFFNLSEYLAKSKTMVNCNDQANALRACSAVLGVESMVCKVRPFGYLNPTHIVGTSGLCNNPGAAPSDVLKPIDDTSRGSFYYHCFVRINGMVYDACMGPVCGMEFSNYLEQFIDCSTLQEKNKGYFSEDPDVHSLRTCEDVFLLTIY